METNDTKFAATKQSVPRPMKTLCRSNKAAGQERVWCMARFKQKTVNTKKTAELLQQFNGLLRFGKHSLICVQFIRETSETQENHFFEFEIDRRY
ncbi:hypothetical protein [uncultured Dysosmobacter sp.]|uniref:hypothetical protein n=1 Tax=uncultured Dysosmobacter sp. TaxID=2591384 RepID=UPI0026058C84|nr:hypothetical protein [uncultured Dysosmobacter sp.]